MIEVHLLERQQELSSLLERQPLQPFLQSWTWGDFQQRLGRKIWRLAAVDGQQLVGSALVVAHELLLGKGYLYCPRGPIADTPMVLAKLLEAIRDLGRRRGVMYVKADLGLYHFIPDLQELAPAFGVGTSLQPQQTLVIDVQQAPEKLLAAMHQKTRYNIRLAEKKNVTVRWSTADGDVDAFLRLMHQTAERQNIRLHGDDYYRALFGVLRETGMAELILGERDGAVRAAHMVIWHGRSATYLHGGSDDTHKEAMIPYLLQWQTIQQAHRRGCDEYDLWGVAPDDIPNHHWAGITRFKKGFGGRMVEFQPSINSILQPQWYQMYRLAKRIRGGRDE